MANDSTPNLPVPGYTKPTHTYGDVFGDEFHAENVPELLASYAGFTQRGVTLAGGQGYLPIGTVIGQVTATKKYKVYASGNGDGTQNPLGILREAVDTGGASSPSGSVATDKLGNMVVAGILNYVYMSGADANAITKLAARVDTVNNWFFF